MIDLTEPARVIALGDSVHDVGAARRMAAEDLQVTPFRRHAPRGADIVHAVAQRDDARGLVAVDHLGQAHQGLAGIVGGQQAAALGVGRPLLQMQIGNQQGRLPLPVQRPGIVGDELLAAQRHGLRYRFRDQMEAFRLQLEHAFPLYLAG